MKKNLLPASAAMAAAAAIAVPRAVAATPKADATDPVRLVAQINEAVTALRTTVDEGFQARSEDVVTQAKLDAINADIDKLMKAYETQSALLAAARLGGAAGAGLSPEAAEHSNAFNTWFRRGNEPASMRELEVAASLTTQQDPDGGYLVPEHMDSDIDRVLGTVSVLRSLARVVQIGTASYTKLINQGGADSGWVGEEASRPATATPKLAQIAINAMEIYANPAATQTLLDDARVDIAAWLADEVAIEFAEQEGAAFITGNGTTMPRGILTYDAVANDSYAWGKLGYVPSGHASAFPAATTTVSPADALIDLYYALKSGYRANAAWIMSDKVMGTVRKFKDAEGNFIWNPPSAVGEVATVLQKPVYTDDNMDAVAAGKFPIAFGDFKRGYTIVDRFGTRILRDPYTSKPFVHFYTTKRVGGDVTNFEAIKLMKIGTS